mmetsp:Transcript_60941/g.109438  ORF Transcript_60941/g.109438 Transcript_60941/m.109438 type:complete len:111 (-) Transcript_60941:100-432(-)
MSLKPEVKRSGQANPLYRPQQLYETAPGIQKVDAILRHLQQTESHDWVGEITHWGTQVLFKRVVLHLPKADDWLCGVAFSSDNKWLASCGYGQDTVDLWPIEVEEIKPGP